MARRADNPELWDKMLKAMRADNYELAREYAKEGDFDIDGYIRSADQYYYIIDGKWFTTGMAAAYELGVSQPLFYKWVKGGNSPTVDRAILGRDFEMIKK